MAFFCLEFTHTSALGQGLGEPDICEKAFFHGKEHPADAQDHRQHTCSLQAQAQQGSGLALALAKKGAAKGGEEKARAERQDPRTHCRWAELENPTADSRRNVMGTVASCLS